MYREPGIVERRHRVDRLALEPELPDPVVLENRRPVAGRDFDDLPPALDRHRPRLGVLERRDQVYELDALALGRRAPQSVVQRVGQHPVSVAGHASHVRAEAPQRPQSPAVDEVVDYDHFAGIEKGLGHEVDSLA